MKKLNIILISLGILILTVAIALQSEWGKGLAQKFLVDALNQSGYRVEIGAFEGTVPHAIELKNVKIESHSLTISVDSVQTRLSIWALLRKELLFTDVKANGISWQEKPGTHPSFGKGKGLSFDLKAKHFTLTDVHFPDGIIAHLNGSLRLGKMNRDFFLDLSVLREGFPDSKLHFTAYLDESKSIRLKGTFKSPTLQALPFATPFDATSDLRFAIRERGNKWTGRVLGTVSPRSVDMGPITPRLETDWKLDARFARSPKEWQITRLFLTSDQMKASGRASFGLNGKFETASFTLQSTSPRIAAKLDLAAKEEGILVQGDASLAKWAWKDVPFENIRSHADLFLKDGNLTGSGKIAAAVYGKSFEGKTDLAWNRDGSFILTDASLHGPYLQGSGNLEIRPDKIILGTTDVTIENLQELPFGLYGQLQGKTDWLVSNGKQVATFDAVFTEFYWQNLFIEKISIDASLIEPFGSLQGRVVLEGENLERGEMSLNRLRFETLLGGLNWPCALSASGQWIHPLELNLDGTWHMQNSHWTASLFDLSGSFYNHPLRLAKPVDFEYAPDLLRLTGLDLALTDARFFLSIEEVKNDLAAELLLENFPLDILSLNPLDVMIGGKTDCSISIHETSGKIDGTLKATIDQMVVTSPGETPPIRASGAITGSFDQDILSLKGGLNIRNTPLLSLDLSLPIHLELHPFQASLIYDKKAKGHLALNGRIEEILDFFDLGTHRIEGNISCDFSLSNTLSDPNILGDLHFNQGYYENYLTGTHLFDIAAEGKARGNVFRLESFTANDGQGLLTATGEISLLPSQSFPYVFDIDFNRLQIAQIDLVSAEATGKIQLTGTTKSALAKGNIEILQTDLHVPEHLPRTVPNLIVVYRNVTKPIEQPELSLKKPFPLQLDLELTAPQGIEISGRGLESEWKGNFHIGGTFTSIAAQGKLELIKGEFHFSSRQFKLLDGSLSFTGLEHEMPTLNLTAQIEIKDISITAHLKGPLNDPQLTLQSAPPLPLSTIMSYLLFGQELAEINSFQALQLANSLAAFAGQGPDVLESTRKALGVDRLNIVSVKNENAELEDTIAVQVGKYVSEGVLVSLTQTAEDSSTNISIEIELKKGWVVQLENDQRQEQGKFTIKWNHNY